MDRSIVQCKIIVVLTTPSVKMVFHTFQYSSKENACVSSKKCAKIKIALSVQMC